MRITVAHGLGELEFDVEANKLLSRRANPYPDLSDPIEAVRQALETPFQFPALRQALTPDDRIALVVDEQLPNLPGLLVPVLEHLISAGLRPEAISLLCPPSASGQPWLQELPEAFEEVRLEVHNPADRRSLAFLTTNRLGRRLYMNRTLVDADQIVVLTGRRYDPLLGHGGAEGALFPAFADEETRQDILSRLSLEPPGAAPWPIRVEAVETAWLLGLPFYVQLIAGSGDHLAHVVAGTADASREGQRLLDLRWRQTVPEPADLVIAAMSGDPERQGFADLAAALACAARVVQPDGIVVLLTQAAPELGAAGDLLRREDDPRQVMERLFREPSLELLPALQWVRAAAQARLFLLSELADDTVEELFATPLSHGGQVQRLLNAGGSCLVIDDAHRALVVVE